MPIEEPDSEEMHLIRRSRNADPSIRLEAAKNIKLPREFLFVLRYDQVKEVRETAKEQIEKRFPQKTKP